MEGRAVDAWRMVLARCVVVLTGLRAPHDTSSVQASGLSSGFSEPCRASLASYAALSLYSAEEPHGNGHPISTVYPQIYLSAKTLSLRIHARPTIRQDISRLRKVSKMVHNGIVALLFSSSCLIISYSDFARSATNVCH